MYGLGLSTYLGYCAIFAIIICEWVFACSQSSHFYPTSNRTGFFSLILSAFRWKWTHSWDEKAKKKLSHKERIYVQKTVETLNGFPKRRRKNLQFANSDTILWKWTGRCNRPAIKLILSCMTTMTTMTTAPFDIFPSRTTYTFPVTKCILIHQSIQTILSDHSIGVENVRVDAKINPSVVYNTGEAKKTENGCRVCHSEMEIKFIHEIFKESVHRLWNIRDKFATNQASNVMNAKGTYTFTVTEKQHVYSERYLHCHKMYGTESIAQSIRRPMWVDDILLVAELRSDDLSI